MKTTRHLLIAIGLAITSVPMFADFTYSNFNSTAGLQLNGNAAAVGGVLRLTPADFWQAGSAFSTNTVSLSSSASFSTYFQFQIHDDGGISDEDGQGADGIVFTVETTSNSVGGSGVGIGYTGIPKSLGVEFDTYNNGGFDPNGNHVNFDYNGNFSGADTAVEIPGRMNDDGIWSAWIDYDGATNDLELRLVENSTVRPAAPILQATVDLASILGSTDAYVGFTSATGAAYDDHDILNWQFRQDFNPINPIPGGGGAVPEPSTYGLIGAAALLGVAGLRRRARRA